MAIYFSPTKNAIQKELTAQLAGGATSAMSLDDVDGIPNKPGICVLDRIDSNNTLTPSKREYIAYEGVSGSTLVGLTRNVDGSGSDQTHAVGAIVEFIPDVEWAQGITDTLSNLANISTSAARFTVGSDAAYDMYVSDGNKDLERIGKGTAGQFLKATATIPEWGSVKQAKNNTWVDLTDASSIYVDFSQSTKFRVSLSTGVTTSRIFHATNATLGDVAMIRIQQSASGSQTANLFTTNASTNFAGGTAPTLTTTANKADSFGFVAVASLPSFDGFIIGQNL